MSTYDVDILLDSENIFSQIPEIGQRSRNNASANTEIRVDMLDILTENNTPDIKKQFGYNFSHTDDTTTKEASILTLTVDLVKLVIKFTKNYQNDIRKVKKVRVSTSTSDFLLPLLKAYNSYREVFSEGKIPENYFGRNLKVYQTVATMLLEVQRVLKEVFMPVLLAEYYIDSARTV